ncbi:Crp/Fnr family transcriptional regulator [Amycolatopsis vancoresmycina]|uniref:CRP/FNR family transcriptional regulator n=1 Tax=Amycolatopsis vancoresmycina DSM 44592 TaxID=1292037 RepID=R1G842_9PSEU|nr:Crp/Fnr family transcriptional regulator [Amycolatopsis vancoresmycina]EOD67563.1 CRP/FNR family transcriptional regulator [Amycolatopsis vancoresmycina DSM 44592]
MHEDGFRALLGEDGRRELDALATPRTFRRADLLCREGDSSRSVLMLLSGRVRITSVTPDGREVVLGVREGGDIVGELAAIEDRSRSATVEALGDVRALEVPGSTFVELCRGNARIAWALVVVLSGRLRGTDRQWLDLTGGSSIRRVAAQLMLLAVRLGVHRNGTVEIAIPATQAELAMTAGLSRESWARATRELRRTGVISTGRMRVTIHRPAELRRLAE